MKINYIIFLFILVPLGSCTTNTKSSHNEGSFLTVENKVIDLPEPSGLEGKKLELKVMGLINGFCVDSLFLFTSLESLNSYKIYNNKTFAYCGDLFSEGSGPNEYLNLSSTGQYECTQDGIKLWVSDNTIQKIRKINITKSLKQKKVVQEKEYSYRGSLYNPFSINDSSFITTFYSWKNFSFSTYNPVSKVKIDKFDFFNQSLMQKDIFCISGIPALKPDKTKFAYAMIYLNQVLITSIDGAKKFSVSIGSPQLKSDIDEANEGDKIKNFSAIAADNSHIWLLYQGEKRRNLEHTIFKAPRSKIVVLDWNGNLLHYFILETNLSTIFMDSNKEILYGIDHNESLFKYDISKYRI